MSTRAPRQRVRSGTNRVRTLRRFNRYTCVCRTSTLVAPGLRIYQTYNRMRFIDFVVDVIAFIEAQAAAAVALSRDDVKVAVAVPVDDVGTGHHLHAERMHNRNALIA